MHGRSWEICLSTCMRKVVAWWVVVVVVVGLTVVWSSLVWSGDWFCERKHKKCGRRPSTHSLHCIFDSLFFICALDTLVCLSARSRGNFDTSSSHEVHHPHLLPPRSNNSNTHSTSLLATPQNHQHDHPPTHRQRQHQFLLHQLRHSRNSLTKVLLLFIFRILPNQLG